jgi:tripartite-type tricarboxylate transporter receptor subunit TctC
VPTFAEAGFPAATATNWFGFSLPAGVQPEIVARWDGELAALLADAGVVERFAAIGVRPGRLGPAEYTALVRAELERWRAVIQAGNIAAD